MTSTPSSPLMGSTSMSMTSSLPADVTSLQQQQQQKESHTFLRASRSGISKDLNKLSLFSRDTIHVVDCDGEREREINEAEQLFQNLPELSYVVTKINQWGKHQKRVLRLTNKGIANVRSDIVSSHYAYGDVRAIYLRDSEVFVLEYTGASHSYVYKSDVGYQIVQEITSRLQMLRTTEKKKHGFDIAIKYQKKLMSQIPGQNAQTPSTPLPTMSGADQQQPQQLSPDSAPNLSLSFDSCDSSSVSSSSSSPTAGMDIEFEVDDRKHQKRASKVSQLLGTTEDQRLQGEIDRIALSPQSSERKAIQSFMSNFHQLVRNPTSLVQNVRQFVDSIKHSILNDKSGQLQKLVESLGAREDDVPISALVEKNLERAIILRAYKQLHGVISHQIAKDEAVLQDNISKLASKSQEFFGIKSEFITQSNWQSAVLELKALEQIDIPYNKLDSILASARAIYNYINYERNLKSNSQQEIFLSADDFLPIYIYVVVNSGVKDLEFTNQYLWQLCDSDRLSGEGEYYLTVFSSTLSLIRSLKMDNVERATMIDDLIPTQQLKGSPPPISSSPTSNGSGWNSATISRRERAQSLSLGDGKKKHFLSQHNDQSFK
ncbi:hypothetical protein SAMD00019534_006480 [Acytostelium subglobosum LB1]|uniref:hypothetical protein n=1 Tax=Acytostelium subglobosum LB1 TaxID=1410327 RepID=UPI000644D083|nr:hypothetical protein SAMD00019534_006480 [Acytostelium subglobosum LB1]GAM17473.1 hypothetical protein SAMD00019534_006480 [Acytostelium subglobosum LB1]|eukprot:XP_012759535.1 hypothetical protein SAMD00019534_006480 [Acytostelium subglobosum LB1]